MKKFIILSMCIWLLGLGHAMGNEIIINDITIPQGGSADLVVSFTNTTESDKVGATLSIQLPKGVSFEKNEDNELVLEPDPTSISKFSIQQPEEGRFALFPNSGSARIVGTSGNLFTLHLQADASLAVGTVLTVTVTKVSMQERFDTSEGFLVKDIPLADFTFNVTIGEPDDGRIKFNETSTKLPRYTAGEKGNVTMTRTIKADSWSTIVLPFTLTAAKAKAAFGDDVHLAEFTGFETDYGEDEDNITPLGITVNFTTRTLTAQKSMVGGKLYLIKTSKDIKSFEANDVTLASEVTDATATDDLDTKGKFTGSLVKTVVPANGLFIAENKFWYSTGKTNIKAFRGWLELDAVVGQETDFGAKVGFFIDGQPTSIDGIGFNGGQQLNGAVYTLGGQLVGKDVKMNQLKKGVYIRDGKKFVVK